MVPPTCSSCFHLPCCPISPLPNPSLMVDSSTGIHTYGSSPGDHPPEVHLPTTLFSTSLPHTPLADPPVSLILQLIQIKHGSRISVRDSEAYYGAGRRRLAVADSSRWRVLAAGAGAQRTHPASSGHALPPPEGRSATAEAQATPSSPLLLPDANTSASMVDCLPSSSPPASP